MLLETKLDDLEQYTRKFNLEICGIPEDEDEDLEDTIIKLSECLDSKTKTTTRTRFSQYEVVRARELALF